MRLHLLLNIGHLFGHLFEGHLGIALFSHTLYHDFKFKKNELKCKNMHTIYHHKFLRFYVQNARENTFLMKN
jgi:hypothetical protein